MLPVKGDALLTSFGINSDDRPRTIITRRLLHFEIQRRRFHNPLQAVHSTSTLLSFDPLLGKTCFQIAKFLRLGNIIFLGGDLGSELDSEKTLLRLF